MLWWMSFCSLSMMCCWVVMGVFFYVLYVFLVIVIVDLNFLWVVSGMWFIMVCVVGLIMLMCWEVCDFIILFFMKFFIVGVIVGVELILMVLVVFVIKYLSFDGFWSWFFCRVVVGWSSVVFGIYGFDLFKSCELMCWYFFYLLFCNVCCMVFIIFVYFFFIMRVLLVVVIVVKKI